MARRKATEATEAAETITATVTTTENESIYTAEELKASAKAVFGTSPDIVAAALRVAKKKLATLSEAKAIVEEFKKRKV